MRSLYQNGGGDGHEVEKRTSWQWNHSMTGQLIGKLKELKNEMDYQNIDFNKYVVTMYSKLQERMAERFPGCVQFVSHKLMILMIAWFICHFPH